MNVNGAGLGLAITERAVAAHGGSVRAQNVAEGGPLVELTLPLGDCSLG
jgi:two-component system OmpR family sensor kinase